MTSRTAVPILITHPRGWTLYLRGGAVDDGDSGYDGDRDDDGGEDSDDDEFYGFERRDDDDDDTLVDDEYYRGSDGESE